MKRYNTWAAVILLGFVLLFWLSPESVQAQKPQYLELEGAVVLTGSKGSDEIESGQFSFYIISETIGVQIDQNVRPVSAGGRVGLGSFLIPGKGTYVFQVCQKDMGEPGMSYDMSVGKVIVTAFYNEWDELETQVQYVKNGNPVQHLVFNNNYEKPDPGVLTPEFYSRMTEVDGEQIVTCRLTYTNTGEMSLYGVYLRQYLPAEGLYLSHEGRGSYGAIDGKEHLTVSVPELMPGECYELNFRYRINLCRPPGKVNTPPLLYEITGNRETIPANMPVDPVNVWTE